jgi:glyoxylate reductase
MKKVLLTEPLFPEVAELLEKHIELDTGKRGEYNTEAAMEKAVSKYDGILSMLSNPLPRSVLEKAGPLRVIGNCAVGYNNIDTHVCRSLGIRVGNTPDVLTNATADGTMALMLAAVRRIPEAERALRKGKFDGWHPTGFLGLELSGKTAGIIGMGRIGQAVAERCLAFGMKIIYHNRNRLPEAIEQRLNAVYCSEVHELARLSDVVLLHCPLTEETHHLVNRDFLNAMPETAFLINAARGPVCDEQELARALHDRRISGAGIDVYEREPEIHPELLSAPGAVLVPHITSATTETRLKMGMLAAGAILNVLCDVDLPRNFVV